jgi:c-di-GMP-binding flagellar brake protein YcgR
MKKLGTIVSSVLIAALVLTLPAVALAAGKTHELKDQIVVSVDTKANTITFKDEKGESHTAPLLGKAVQEASHVKPNEKVNFSCQDNEKGEHQGVIAIKKAA